MSIDEDIKEKFEGSTMSKAGRLAMELTAERKRLKQEMTELQMEVEDLKPTTPTGTLDSYVKWAATISAVTGIFLQQADFFTAGQSLYALSAICWIYVGSIWNDKAIMIGSAISGTAVLLTLTKYYS